MRSQDRDDGQDEKTYTAGQRRPPCAAIRDRRHVKGLSAFGADGQEMRRHAECLPDRQICHVAHVN